ncbi:MAG: hypothetical protein U0Q16_18270 [Bryobacteraceae bacterium]
MAARIRAILPIASGASDDPTADDLLIGDLLRKTVRSQPVPAGLEEAIKGRLDPKAPSKQPRVFWAMAGAAVATVLLGLVTYARLSPPAPPQMLVLKRYSVASVYRDLAEEPVLDTGTIAMLSHPSNQAVSLAALALLREGRDLAAADLAGLILRRTPDDLGALEIMAIAYFKRQDWKRAYSFSVQAHVFRPEGRLPVQCWITLQFALLASEPARAIGECGHLDEAPKYNKRTRAILRELRRRNSQPPRTVAE